MKHYYSLVRTVERHLKIHSMLGNNNLWHMQTFILYSFFFILAVNRVLSVNGNPPDITYTCDTNGINAITVSDGTYDNMKVKKDDDTYCQRTQDGQDGFLECARTNMLQNGKHLKLIYEDDNEADVLAGKHIIYYDLSCDEKTETKTVSFKLTSLSATDPPLRTTLKANARSHDLSLTASPTTDLYVGKDLTLTMKMQDVGHKYLLSPQKCEAHRPGKTETIIIWECNTPINNPNIINKLTWTKGSVVDVTSVTIPMFAFKFIDTSEVVIECTTKVCTAGNDECNLDKCVPAPTASFRKRRSQDGLTEKINSPIGYASVSLEVKDPLYTKSSVSGLSIRWYAYAVPAFLLIGSRFYL